MFRSAIISRSSRLSSSLSRCGKVGGGGGAAGRCSSASAPGAVAQRRLMSSGGSSGGPLEADSNALSTHVFHKLTLSLAVLAPVYFVTPADDGFFNKTFGLLLTTNISAHAWIGLNYVATDYVPKVSKKLLGPARVFNVGLVGILFLGLSQITFTTKGGIKGVLKGLWNPPTEKKK